MLDCKIIYMLLIIENTMGMSHLKIMDGMKSCPIIRILCNIHKVLFTFKTYRQTFEVKWKLDLMLVPK
jgi:hypothetical protein